MPACGLLSPRLARYSRGRAPIWRYGMALHLLHGSPAAAVAFYDLHLGAVVVASHRLEWVRADNGCDAT